MFTSAKLSGELLKLYDLAAHAERELFEERALRQLGRLVGFDGGVWGLGRVDGSGRPVLIDSAMLFDRPRQMVDEFQRVAFADPVTERFIAQPEVLQSVVVSEEYADPAYRAIREYLDAYDVGALLLQGMGDPTGGHLAWITAYRSRSDGPFSARDAARMSQLLPHWFRAHSLCVRLNQTDQRAAGTLTAQPVIPIRGTLSQRQIEVLTLLAQGQTYAEAALRLGISPETVKEHASIIYGRLGVRNKAAAVYKARLKGLL